MIGLKDRLERNRPPIIHTIEAWLRDLRENTFSLVIIPVGVGVSAGHCFYATALPINVKVILCTVQFVMGLLFSDVFYRGMEEGELVW